MADVAGNKVTLTYDSQMRIVAITDAIGQVSTLTYGLSGKPLVVTQITDPFGRSASFTYNASGQLASITDVLGITSSYTYGQGSDPDFVNTLTTPYGATTFTYGDSSTNGSLGNTRFLRTVDPLNRTSYVEYAQSVDPADATGGVLKNPRTTSGRPQHLQPVPVLPEHVRLRPQSIRARHARRRSRSQPGEGLSLAAHRRRRQCFARSRGEKEPLENRVWYSYANQPAGACGSILSPRHHRRRGDQWREQSSHRRSPA